MNQPAYASMAPNGALRRFSSLLYRRPNLYLALLLLPPLLWFGAIYLGSLLTLLWQGFYTFDDFSMTVTPDLTLGNFKALFQAANFDIILRTLTMAVAVSMASAALCSMMTDDPDTIHCAASLGGQVLMGLLCNPIEGYVQVPCIVRNMAAVPTAVTCANAALAGMDHIVPLDDVVALMLAVGEKIRPCDEAGTYILKKEEE